MPHPEMITYYSRGQEAGRLNQGLGLVEQARTRVLLAQHLPPPRGAPVVLDVGGGPGAYALWLARQGYQVHLVDAVQLHVDQAWAGSSLQPETPILSAQVGDARRLNFPDAFADAVLLKGPLYHLHTRDDRVLALREAARVLRPGGLLFAAAISRWASTFVGLQRGWIFDVEYLDMVHQELEDGRHIRPLGWPTLFPTAFFHEPAELAMEIEEAGLMHLETLAVEGPATSCPDLDARWHDSSSRQALMDLIQRTERDPVALGVSAHMLALARGQPASR